MRVLLAPAGTRGDVAPMCALAHGLQRAGHDVLLMVPTGMTNFAADRGLPAVSAGSDIAALIERNADRLSDPRAVFGILVRETARELRAQISAIEARAGEFDLVLGGGVQIGAPSVCAGLGVPYRTVLYTPSVQASREYSPFWLPWRNLPQAANRWLHLLPDAVNGVIALGPLQRWRRAHGMGRVIYPIEAMVGAWPMLAVDPRLATAASDVWPPIEQVGWLRPQLDAEPGGQTLEPDLERFLQAGPPPVYLGYGSMVDADAVGTLAMAAQLCRAGHRVVVARGWSKQVAAPADPRLMVIDGAPHGALLPRCFGAVHHGGAGTTHAVACAGIPQFVVPHLLDQFDLGERVFRLGLGPAPVKRSKLDAPRLLAAVQRMASDGSMQARAAEVGAAIAADDGVGRAVHSLERFVASWHATTPAGRGPWSAAAARSGRLGRRAPPELRGMPAEPLPTLPARPKPPWLEPRSMFVGASLFGAGLWWSLG
jgi:vancomycin aglycone glucosyltransferase